MNGLITESNQFIASHRFCVRTGVEPDVEVIKFAACLLPLAKISLGFQCGNLFGNRHDKKLVHRYLLFLRHLTGLSEKGFRDTQRIIGHQVFSSCSRRKYAPGDNTGSRKWLAGTKSAIFNVTSASVRPFNVVIVTDYKPMKHSSSANMSNANVNRHTLRDAGIQ